MVTVDLVFLPRGLDEFSAAPESIWRFSLSGETVSQIYASESVRIAQVSHWLAETLPAGSSSPLAARIEARARRARDRAAFKRWDRDPEEREFVSSILGTGRSLG